MRSIGPRTLWEADRCSLQDSLSAAAGWHQSSCSRSHRTGNWGRSLWRASSSGCPSSRQWSLRWKIYGLVWQSIRWRSFLVQKLGNNKNFDSKLFDIPVIVFLGATVSSALDHSLILVAFERLVLEAADYSIAELYVALRFVLFGVDRFAVLIVVGGQVRLIGFHLYSVFASFELQNSDEFFTVSHFSSTFAVNWTIENERLSMKRADSGGYRFSSPTYYNPLSGLRWLFKEIDSKWAMDLESELFLSSIKRIRLKGWRRITFGELSHWTAKQWGLSRFVDN